VKSTTTQFTDSGETKARYIMIGGFLGAGKTTAVSKLAAYLTKQGLRVGLITNDQGATWLTRSC
jgi:signal recognition particle GTPase